MNDPKRWREFDASLPKELSRALAAVPGEPDAGELAQLASELGRTLGVALPVAKVTAAAQQAAALAKVGTSVATTATASSFGWVPGILGGAVLGVGLSGAIAYGVAQLDSPAPLPGAPSRAARPAGKAAAASAFPQAAPTAAPTAEIAAPATTALAHPHPSQAAIHDGSTAGSESTQESELQMLKRAQVALGHEPAAALRLVDQHARQFAGGQLAQEREVIAIDALMRLGRTTDAVARAARFRAAFPGSAHQRRVDVLLGATTEGARQP